MALQSQFYEAKTGVRTYVSTKHIASKQHMAVWFRRITFTPPEDEWVVLPIGDYDLINNTAVLDEAADITLYDTVEVRVADTPDELLDSPSDIALVASIAADIQIVAGIDDQIILVSDNNANITIVAGLNAQIVDIASEPLRSSILAAQANADAAIASAAAALASEQAAAASQAATAADLVLTNLDVLATAADVVLADAAKAAAIVAQTASETAQAAAVAAKVAAELAATNAGNSETASAISETNSAASAVQAQLRAWEAQAEYLTAASYATEPEDVFVKVWTSDGDGTFTSSNTTTYSALHWESKTAAAGVPVPVFPTDEGLALVARVAGNDWEKILGLPLETDNAHKTVTTKGVEGDSFWSPLITSPDIIVADFTLADGANASIVSPTINDGVTVTIPDGSTLVIL